MKQRAHIALVFGALVLVGGLKTDSSQAQTSNEQTAAPAAPVSSPSPAGSFPWPNQFTHDEQAFTVYPPQLDRWQGEQLEGRAVVSVQPADAQKPVFGVVWLSARTKVDSATGTVSVRDITVSRGSFPTAAEHAGAYLDSVRQHLSMVSWNVARERLESELAIEHASRQVQSQPLGNNVPRILYSESPAILVPIDGAPQLKEMVGLDLLRVLNTRALILQEKLTGRYFLFVAGHWLEAPALEGPWAEASVRPAALERAKQQALASDQVDLIEGADSAQGRVPVVFVSSAPAELVQTDGPPQYAPIARTQLLYVTNSPNRLFLDLPTQQYYLLLSGRWYRASSLRQGAWEYVLGTSLPADIARIPENHPTESVRASVPGTPQAAEAVIENSVPQVATVKRSAATLEITYDGSPQFQIIEGTALQHAVNAPIPVIRVDENAFYALSNSVWFVANSPFGPWTAATSVPPVIYTIPRSSPVHYVTYVRVYEATPEVVYEGYTPGYVGSYVAPENTVVYGTGWSYQPWVGSVWYGQPVTWGFGFSAFNSWWDPWPWSPWWGAGWWGTPFPCFQPAWGPWVAPVAVAPRGGLPLAVGRQVAPVNVNKVPANNVNPGLPAAVAHGVAPANVSKVAVSAANANTANMAHIFQRWGTKVATPVGGATTVASIRTSTTHPPGGLSQPALQSNAGTSPVQSAGAARHNLSLAPAQASAAPANHAMPPPGTNTNTAAPVPAPSVASQTPARPLGENPNVHAYRERDGHWQRFVGNGQWENLRPTPNLPSIAKSAPAEQGSGPQGAATGSPRNLPGVPNRGSPGSNANRPLPPPAPPIAMRNYGPPVSLPGRAGPSVPGHFASPQMHTFVPGNGRFVQGWGGGPPAAFGRGGGGGAPSQGHAMGGGHAMAGGGGPGGGALSPGHAGGGGGHTGGGSSHH